MFMSSLKKSVIIEGIAVLAVVTVAFYWFSWRPMQIRKDCAHKAVAVAGGVESLDEEVYKFGYTLCVQIKGL